MFLLLDNNLDQLLRGYEKVCHIANEILSWPKKIERHQEEIKRDGIEDSVIENFQIQRLTAITNGYGKEAIDHALSKLQAWHDHHYWKSKKSKKTVDAPQDAVTSPRRRRPLLLQEQWHRELVWRLRHVVHGRLA